MPAIAALMCNDLAIISLQRKPGPVVRSAPNRMPAETVLRLTQRRSRCHASLEHVLIENFHQFRRRFIINLPKTRHDTRSSGVHESTGQSDQSLTSDFFPQSGLTCTQNHQRYRRTKSINIAKRQKTILRFSVASHSRKDQSGIFRSIGIEISVRREMKNRVLR